MRLLLFRTSIICLLYGINLLSLACQFNTKGRALEGISPDSAMPAQQVDTGSGWIGHTDAPNYVDINYVDISNAFDSAQKKDVFAGCPSLPPLQSTAGKLEVPLVIAGLPIVLDGNDDDWRCNNFYTLTKNSGVPNPGGDINSATNSATFSLSWDSQALYFIVKVVDADVKGTATTSIFNNDSVELYFDGDGITNGDYVTYEHQFVLDHLGAKEEWGGLQLGTLSPAGLTAVSKKTSSGFTIEGKVSASVLRLGAVLLKDASLGFDLALNTSDGTKQVGQLFWFLANPVSFNCTTTSFCQTASCQKCCAKSDDHPWCNTMWFGRLALK